MSLGNQKASSLHCHHSLKLVYFALAYPFLQYCISSWGGVNKTSLHPLFVKQKLIIKTMLFKRYDTSSSPLFKKLDLLKLPENYQFQVGKLMHSQVKNNVVTSDNLCSISTVHSYNTRQAANENYYVPSVHLNLGQTSFSYCGPIIWNSLPVEIKTASRFRFKTLLKRFLLQKYLTT